MMVIDSLARGGRERRLLELLKHLKKDGAAQAVLVLFSSKIEYPEVHQMGVPIHIFERKPAKDPRVFYRLYRLCKAERPDVLHSWGWMSSVYAVPAAKMLGIPLLNAAITDAPLGMNWLDNRYFRAQLTFPFSAMVASNSKAGLRTYQAPADRSVCIYNGFDFRRIQQLRQPGEMRQQLGITTKKLVGMVAGFFPRKDYDTFFKCAAYILDRRTDVSFLAIGDGLQLEHFRKQIPERHKDRLLLPGQMKGVESLVNCFDVGMLCSITEGVSNAIMEYMVLGKPVVASAVGGTPELVIDGETGHLFDIGDWQSAANHLNKLLDDPEKCKEMGRRGSERIRQEFSLKDMGAIYLDLYKRMLNHKIAAAV